jgi:MazG family protein
VAICDELGDLLLQIVFHCQIFAEGGVFDLADVAEAISDKLVRRHPHVFADVDESDIEALNAQWDRIKQQENGLSASETSALDGIPTSLPALLRADKILGRLMRRGLSPSIPDAARRLSDLQDRLDNPGSPPERESAEKYLGEAVLAAVLAGRQLGVNAEDALRSTLSDVEARFRELEKTLLDQGLTLESISPEDLKRLWEEEPTRKGDFLFSPAKT